MKKHLERPDPERVLGGLKDFQRQTVDYVFRRMYTDADYTRRFLVADEVGLGKTMIARGLIAKALDHMWDKVDRIDVVYICSNGDIARQNVNKLRIGATDEFAMASRITLLPSKLKDLQNNRLNFISFTPSTSFDLKSAMGTGDERVLLFHMLDAEWGISHRVAPYNIFCGLMQRDNFKWMVEQSRNMEIDKTLKRAFLEELRRMNRERPVGEYTLQKQYDNLSERFGRTKAQYSYEDHTLRSEFIGRLRTVLARTCLRALEPDLIILDEFQRFKNLLSGTDQSSELAHGLFDYSDSHSEARVVMLSATPYKMFTQSHESENDDHYVDFLRTVTFLQNSAEKSAQFERLVNQYRSEILRIRDGSLDRLREIKCELEVMMRKVMVRTERLASTANRDGMLKEMHRHDVRLEASDVRTYAAIQKVARVLESDDTIEYWKSAPYLFNFMDDYQLKKKFEAASDNRDLRGPVIDAVGAHATLLFPWKEYEGYRKVDPSNGRLRALMADTVGTGAWQLLWVPPALPYYKLAGPFAQPELAGFTKRLIFSSWKVVPKSIAALVSYEAERLMISSYEDDARNNADARKRRRPLLMFARSDKRLTGMPVLGILYPCETFAAECDPIVVGRELQRNTPGKPDLAQVLAAVRGRINSLLNELAASEDTTAVEDEQWYWAAPILLDMKREPARVRQWLAIPDLAAQWSVRSDTPEGEGEDETRWSDHVEDVRRLQNGSIVLGRRPADLADVLALMAVAAPGTVALRALRRVVTSADEKDQIDVRTAAAQMAWGARNLFNLPEATAMIRGTYRNRQAPDESAIPYWQLVLRYAAEGCFQSVIDEYVHYTREAQGLFDRSATDTADGIAKTTVSALTLRTATVRVDDVKCRKRDDRFDIEKRSMRTHFALRFGDEQSEDEKQGNRKEQVRDAFNSPFWPFVIASTSVGQEGLDFHPYCHAVVHWNLPSNPVDLEQREGRVHRYKGHAVRKNLAMKHGDDLLRDGNGHLDPWASLFHIGEQHRANGASDLVPYWIYPVEGGASIERHILALPLSRDRERAASLRRALTIYRMVFGQNRQEDLLAYFDKELTEEQKKEAGEALRVELGPSDGLALQRSD